MTAGGGARDPGFLRRLLAKLLLACANRLVPPATDQTAPQAEADDRGGAGAPLSDRRIRRHLVEKEDGMRGG